MKKISSIHKKVQREIDLLSEKKRKDMTSLERVRLLQLKLYLKAKQEEEYNFYILYDKIFLDYILEEAYKRSKAKDGSPGVDCQSFDAVEKYGKDRILSEIKEEIRTHTYKPQPVKRVWIEKPGGGERPLGIPTIKDRVVQQACKIVIEPIFEADFNDSSYGFRPKRSAKGAITEIRNNLKEGKHVVYDADLSKYFDTIPHDKLEIVLRERITDSRVLDLIRQWLKVPIVEEDGKYSGGRSNRKGTPQGGVISPLLANIYMNVLDRVVNSDKGYFSKRGITMIRYADDFILMSRHINQKAVDKLHNYLRRMDLSINTKKSKLVNAKKEPFDFLGFRFRYDRSIFSRHKRFWNIIPKPSSEKKVRQKIRSKLKSIGHYPPEEVVLELNALLRGWMNYYKIEKVSYTQVSFKKLDKYLRTSLRRYYNRKSQRKSCFRGQDAYYSLVSHGLIKPYKSYGIRPAFAQRRN